MICRKLRLKPGERLLDIGCGWGALRSSPRPSTTASGLRRHAVRAAARLAREKAERRASRDQRARSSCRTTATARGDDRFDKIASVGMFEHVGVSQFRPLFRDGAPAAEARRALSPSRHRPARRQPRGAHGKKRPEFEALTRYIFPGGELDYIGRTVDQSRAARLRGARRRGLARALPAHHALLARPPCARAYDEACAEVGEVTTARAGSPISPPARSPSSATMSASIRRWR